MTSWMYIYLQTRQVVYINYVQLFSSVNHISIKGLEKARQTWSQQPVILWYTLQFEKHYYTVKHTPTLRPGISTARYLTEEM